MDSFLLLRRLVAAIVFKGQTVSDYWWSRRTIFLTESNPGRLGLLSPTHAQRCSQKQNVQITLQSVLINKPKFLKAARHAEIRKRKREKAHGDGVLELVKPAREPDLAAQSPVHPWKNAPGILPARRSLLALVGRRPTVVRYQLFPQKPPGSLL